MIALHPHPSLLPSRPMAVAAEVWRKGWTFRFRFTLEAPDGAVAVPEPAAIAERRDELWRHTCFEAFIGGHDERYVELNFAPSGDWAAYAFSRYREGMRPLEMRRAPRIAVAQEQGRLQLEATLSLREACGRSGAALGLAAVVEEADGRISYWALEHRPERPDFHHGDCFVAALP
jgi:hypothetical protein